MPQTDGQLTKNHHLHPCVNMLQCWDKIEFISESLEGQSKKKKKKNSLKLTTWIQNNNKKPSSIK